jgi:prevent-host-death family protein
MVSENGVFGNLEVASQSSQEVQMDSWTLQDAKNRFSQVVETAMSQQRPQIITKRGKNSAVLLSYDEYQKLVQPTKTLLEALRPDQPIGVDLEIVRDSDPGRDIEL